ncbi:alpha/beta hydrolase [Microbacterium sp. cx-55]|uniref:alpha/beta hydrolase n=1 Tax=Microbacterium sp. cx-55 TaxID=2875948 RepID=UPI001CBF7C44|nr:alpha/beta hydrolase [Microbacterium sp. cx-55]MBZ4488035.1 alpha/beta hydrolase [Microbacterium sp. cx-55]UGB34559.1 alpha/beta hydrolase [Microbacterium sp. cx-55]
MTRTSRTIRGVFIAVVAAASVALAGCSFIPDSPTRPSTSAEPDVSGVEEALIPFYSQDLAWEDCGGTFDCTTVRAPLDWNEPDAGDIELSVVRQRATDGEPQGSLLTNPGGPGASGVDLIQGSIDFAVGEALQADYDIIGFDPRGVGRSTAVKCYDARDMDAYLFDIPAGTRGSAQWTDELTQRSAQFAAACDENSDGILPFITTVQSARDMDLLRGVLGDEKLNYLGYSYGTFLGATYADLYPDRVGRLVLDGALDPQASSLEVSTTQGVGFESALRSYMADCLGGSDCPFAGTVDDAMADLGTLLASVDRTPLANDDGRQLGADSLLTAIIAALYSQDSWPYLTTALSSALQGQAGPAFQLADFYYARSGGTYSDNSTEAFTAYNCMDYPADNADHQAAAEALLAEKAPTVAPYWGTTDGCASWPAEATGTRTALTADGAAPIVVVGTTGDPATPYEWSVALADQLSSGVLITRVGEGHTGYNKGNACVDDAVEKYFTDGTVPTDGLRCE